MHNNLSKEFVFAAVEYLVNRYQAMIPALERFCLEYFLHGLDTLMQHNCFLFDEIYYYQIETLALDTKAAVKCFSVFSRTIHWILHIIDTYFRYLYNVFYEWLFKSDEIAISSIKIYDISLGSSKKK